MATEVTDSRSIAMLIALRASASSNGAFVVLSCRWIIASTEGNQNPRFSGSLATKAFSMSGMNWSAQSVSPLMVARLAGSLPANASIWMPSIFCLSGCQ